MIGENGIRLPGNADCIIYNDHGTGTARIAIKRVLKGVWWEERKGVNVINKGVASANSVEIIMSSRDGYLNPAQWQAMSKEQTQESHHFTLQEGDRVIFADETALDAPPVFSSMTDVDKHFGASNSHEVMSIDAMRLPGGRIHHYEIGCR